ncbi:MAG: translocation/assembly module TamB domain-containing protein [Proteobacteria bacterium]|nr:translocation/assembly module TamB domain-containing protein [Pseudomonadota bacterium]
MKRRIMIWLSAVFFILVVAGVIFWGMYTNHGARWVLEGVLRSLPVKIQIEKIAGSLAGGLKIEGIKAETKKWKIGIDSIDLSCQPLYIVTGSMAVKNFVVQGISFDDKYPNIRTPLDLTWPKPPRFLSYFNGWVKSFEINGLVYRSGDREFNIINRLTTKITWFFGTLAADNLKMESPIGKTEGDMKTGFAGPTFSASLKMTLEKKIPGIESLVLTMKLKEAHKPEQMAGPFQIVALSGNKENLKTAGRLGVRRNDLSISELITNQQGRKGKLLAEGGIDFSSGVPLMNLHINVSDFNLSREANYPAASHGAIKVDTSLSGAIELKSDFVNYSGSYSLKNNVSSWKAAHIKGAFEMNLEGMKSLTVDSSLLNGTITGQVKASWVNDIILSGSFQARGLNPAGITSAWQGQINMNLEGGIRWSKSVAQEGIIKVDILNSMLRNKALTGNMDARWHQGMFNLVRFALHGNGFDLSASGALEDKINYLVRISDLSGLIPGSEGRLTAEGWTRQHKGQLAGILKAGGSDISAFGAKMGSVNVEALLNNNGGDSLKGKAKIRSLAYGALKAGSLDMTVQGAVPAHNIMVTIAAQEGKVQASLNGGYAKGVWQGTIMQMNCSDTSFGSVKLLEPAAMKISSDHFTLSRLSLIGSSNERLEADADLAFHPILGYAKIKWQDLNVARVNFILAGTSVAGHTSGFFDAQWSGNNIMKVSASVRADDTIINGPVSVRMTRGDAKFNWNEKGLIASWDIKTGDAGRVEGQVLSKRPAFIGIPEAGQFETTWETLNVDMIKSWIHPALDLKGYMNGKLKGRFLPGRHFEVSGKTKLSQGSLAWKSEEGLITAKAEKADMDMEWDETALKGNLSLLLLNRGYLKAGFRFPIPACFPVSVEPQGQVKLIASGEVQENGLLTAIFPGLIGESQGQLTFDLTAGGTWKVPDLQGNISLANASAYLYPAGIRLKDIKVEAQLKENCVNISSFGLHSGNGSMQGNAMVWVNDWRIMRYEGKINGGNLQTVYLPELQVLTNPDLSFKGDMQNFVLRGSVMVPEALIQRTVHEGLITSSPDVVIVDLPEKQKKPLRMGFDMQVNVILGNKVMINIEGLNARLEGKVFLTAQNLEKVAASGQIQVAKGQYDRHGISLGITRGRIVFTGGPAEFANLDILAVRKIRDVRRLNDVQAGVSITGTPRLPLVKLYSEPAMPDMDILSYIVLGKSMETGTDSNQAGLLLQAAGTMLAKDQSSALQSQVMKFAGLDTFDVQTGSSKTSSSQISSIQPRGIAGQSNSTTGDSSVSSSIVTVGKYLSPELYIAFGRSLFTGDYLATARYSFLRNWEVEGSRKGTDSGVDLFYRVEFK